jgi:Zn-dependent peptidase ImmA (M78 family)
MASPAQSARAFRERHGLGHAPVRDIIQVVEDFCGANVLSRPFPRGYDAFTVQDEASGMTIIAVGTTDNYERQRFTIAHEIGHLESGRMSADVHSLPDYRRSPDEVWADNFARHLLIPDRAVDGYLADAGVGRGRLALESLSDLVRVFAVSPAVAMIQLRDAGRISQDEHEAWSRAQPAWTSHRLAVKFGWASEREAMVRSSRVPRRPTRIVRAATAAYQDGNVSLESLAQTAGERDLKAFSATLEDSGITPAMLVPEPADGWEAEDLSDLYRPDE